MSKLKIKYLHDGGPSRAEMIIEPIDDETYCYSYLVSFTDPTDYARFPMNMISFTQHLIEMEGDALFLTKSQNPSSEQTKTEGEK